MIDTRILIRVIIKSFKWGKAGSCLEVGFSFNYIYLSEPIIKKHMGSLSGPK